VKIATNSELAAKKKHWIDFDAGQLIHGKAMPELLRSLWTALWILLTASRPVTRRTISGSWRSLRVV
jgi:altronate dehydratase